MKFWVGVTDNQWFQYLAAQGFDEVNFWQPSGKAPFVKAPLGMPFLFKLKSPYNAIAGGGFFVAFSVLPVSVAWEVFGAKNGARSLQDLETLLNPLSRAGGLTREIGCTILANPFYLPKEDWLRSPPGWSSNIVTGKFYNQEEPSGKEIWHWASWQQQVGLEAAELAPFEVREPGTGLGAPTWKEPRLGQSSFRVLVTDAYKRKCAMTGETTLVALEAAHIMPYSKLGTHEVRNGLLLRADFHRLFDVGLVSVGPDFRIKVSPRIREAWFNGKAYYRLNDQPLAVLPERPVDRPDRDLLAWHLRNCFQA